MSKEYLYTEEVQLPSLGKLNPEIPKGLVTIRCIELRDQKYLAGSKNLQTNKAVSLLQRCIIKPENINVKKLSQVDIFFLLIKLRILSYGGTYSYLDICPVCERPITITCNLEDLTVDNLDKDFDVENLKIVLPRKGDTVYTHIQTQEDSEYVESETERIMAKFKDVDGDPSVFISVARIIDKIELKEPDKDGKKEITNQIDILKYVEDLTDLDALAIKSTIENIVFGVNTTVKTICPSCGKEIFSYMKTTAEFFRPRYVR